MNQSRPGAAQLKHISSGGTMKPNWLTRFGLATAIATIMVAAPQTGFADELDPDSEDFYVLSPEDEAKSTGQNSEGAEDELPADTPPWHRLLYKLYTEGERDDLAEYNNHIFKRGTSFDRNVSRSVNYINLTVKSDQFGRFLPMSVSAVVEKWTKKEDGGWEVYQLISYVDLGGELRQVLEAVLTFDSERILKDYKTIATEAASSPKERERWEAQKASWIKDFVTDKNADQNAKP